jgi:hypothetical protein
VATLVTATFIGAEALLLVGFDREILPIRSALRRFSVVIRKLEESQVGREGIDHASVPADS